ncbi:phage tail tape measure protein [Salinicola avicenniae]|uniref:phage tail tape measure protein n=1 Tax=Salinicola avicenniae TaxID=2916836 RepID=UPI00207432F4|nr:MULTISPECIES: phage tail tape measure protein [unclassified Salinicola]
MARNLKLQLLFKAADRVTAPLKKISRGSQRTADALRANREQLTRLEKQQQAARGFRQVSRDVKSNNDALRTARQRLKQVRDATDALGVPTKQMAREHAAAARQVERLTGKQNRYLGKMQDAKQRLREAGLGTRDLARHERELGERITDTTAAMRRQQAQLDQLANKQRRLTTARRAYDKSMSLRTSMAGTGAGMLATGGAGVYGAARLLSPGIDYGTAMSRVQALTRLDKDDPRLQALRDQARDLGASTAFSATQAGDAQGFLAMAGFDPEAIKAAMPDMLNLALANGTDLGRTADLSSNILSGFGLDPDQMGRVGDVLTATTTRANVDLEMLGESMKYVAPQARQMGLSLEQAAAMTGLLGNVGIQGSQAGTTLRAMMTRLAAPTGAAAGALEDLGVNAKDAEGNMRDVPRILADVAQATENMGNADRAAYLKAIFGEEPGAGMAELIAQQGAAGVEKFVEILTQAGGENARVAKTMSDNIGGDLKSLRSAWEEVGISITDTNEGPLRDLIQSVTGIVRGVGDWIKENPELAGTITRVAAGIAVLVAAGGALTLSLASLLGPVAMLRYGLAIMGIKSGGTAGKLTKLAKGAIPMIGKALLWLGRVVAIVGRAFLLNPIGLAVAAIAGAAYLIYRNWDAIAGFFRDRWRDVKAAFDEGVGGVVRLLANWNPLGLIYRGIVAVLRKLGVEVPDSMATLGDAIVNGLGAAWEGIKNLWDWFKNAPGRAIDYVVDLVGEWDLLGQLEEKWTAAIDYLKSLPSRMWSAGADVATGLSEGIRNGASSVVDSARGMADGAVDSVKNLLDIHSPSRVFRQIGGYTVDGFNQGLDRQRDEPARRIADIAKRVTQAGAGIALGTAALPTAAMPAIEGARGVPLDTRPPIAAPGGTTVQITIGDINVNAAPGMDERALARYVAAEVQRALAAAERESAARTRRNFYDND